MSDKCKQEKIYKKLSKKLLDRMNPIIAKLLRDIEESKGGFDPTILAKHVCGNDDKDMKLLKYLQKQEGGMNPRSPRGSQMVQWVAAVLTLFII